MQLLKLLTAVNAVSAATLAPRQESDIDPLAEIESFEPTDEIAKLVAQGLEEVKAYEASGIESRSKSSCGLSDVSIRRDWVHLSGNERKAYSSAVLCLMGKPSQLDQTLFPGAKTRYDDFVVVHVNQSRSIHATGNFLTWHRYFVWGYEQALKNECGYKGAQPYWNWGTYSHDPVKSPVFDGSATSMSGNGQFLQHNGSLAGTGFIFIPSGAGGGCITSGPFKDMKVNIGPIQPTQDGVVKSPSMYAYNPRCLKRDISTYAASTWTRPSQIVDLIFEKDVEAFQNNINGNFREGNLGIHSAGHYTIGGDPGADFFASPGDPVFFLHHAMVDRTYWIHQTLHLPKSLTDVSGTITIFNNPPSRNATLSDPVGLGPIQPEVPLGSLLNTVGGGPLCYIYL